MKNLNELKILSNTSVVDIHFIDEIADNLTCGEKIEPKDIVNLARLIETFILSNEVIIIEDDVVWDPIMHYNNNYDFEFTDKWIETFSRNNIIRTENDSVSTLLSNKFFQYNSLKNPVTRFYDENEFHFMRVKERKNSTRTWCSMTDDLAIPFIVSDWEKSIVDANKCTNISLYAYSKIENDLKQKFKSNKDALSIGPREVRIPSLLSMVLQEAKYIEDIPKITIQIRNNLSKFINTVTKLQYEFKIAKTDKERSEIIGIIDNCYDSIKNFSKHSNLKTHIISVFVNIFLIIFNCITTENFTTGNIIKENISNILDIFSDIIEICNEVSGVYSIAGYYNFWNATREVKEALPLLKNLFGKQIDDEFIIKLNNMT